MVVNKINQQPNSKELYQFIYDEMIQPSVEHIKAGRMKQAQRFYSDCIVGLKTIFDTKQNSTT